MFATLESGGYNITNEKYFLNPYFNNQNHLGQQNLHDILVQEQIQTKGIELVYLVREHVDIDELYGEDPNNYFSNSKKFQAYLESFDGYEGQGSIFEKFGFRVNDEITISINPNLFYHQTKTYPKEGDLIYLPLDNQLFEITWCTPKQVFYQFGKLPIAKIQAQKFIYSHEKIDSTIMNKEISSDLYNLDLNELTELESKDIEQLMITTEKLSKSRDTRKTQYKEDKKIHQEFKQINVDTSPINGNQDLDVFHINSDEIEFLDDN